MVFKRWSTSTSSIALCKNASTSLVSQPCFLSLASCMYWYQCSTACRRYVSYMQLEKRSLFASIALRIMVLAQQQMYTSILGCPWAPLPYTERGQYEQTPPNYNRLTVQCDDAYDSNSKLPCICNSTKTAVNHERAWLGSQQCKSK